MIWTSYYETALRIKYKMDNMRCFGAQKTADVPIGTLRIFCAKNKQIAIFIDY